MRRTYSNSVKKYRTFRILILFEGRKSIKPNKMVLSPTKAKATSDIEPPYWLKILFGMSRMYRKNSTKTPKIIYPYGLLYFELDRNKK
jgi:hypothetical protein